MPLEETVRVEPEIIPLSLVVNGKEVSLNVEAHLMLLDLLRDRLGLKGAKRSCDLQVCGACTVLVDGQAISACTLLAYEARGASVLTIEGMADGEKLHPIQQSFIDNAAFQCGYCTPGMILAAKSLLDENPNPSEDQVKEYMKGNICRCTGYKKSSRRYWRRLKKPGSEGGWPPLAGRHAVSGNPPKPPLRKWGDESLRPEGEGWHGGAAFITEPPCIQVTQQD